MLLYAYAIWSGTPFFGHFGACAVSRSPCWCWSWSWSRTGRASGSRASSAGGWCCEAFDEREELADEFSLRRPGAPVNELLFERGEERLGEGVEAPMSRAGRSWRR